MTALEKHKLEIEETRKEISLAKSSRRKAQLTKHLHILLKEMAFRSSSHQSIPENPIQQTIRMEQ